MSIALKADFSIAAEPAELLFDFAAYPGERAMTVLCHLTDQTFSLARFERERLIRAKIDGTMVPGVDECPQHFHRAVFCRVGTGFALVSPKAAALWRTLDSEPQSAHDTQATQLWLLFQAYRGHLGEVTSP